MEFYTNPDKELEIEVEEDIYIRHAIKTRFINANESYIDVFKEYVSPIYEEGDIISCSEKIISLCQNRIIKREDIQISIWAKILSFFASKPTTGIAVGESIKMQYAINKVRIT